MQKLKTSYLLSYLAGRLRCPRMINRLKVADIILNALNVNNGNLMKWVNVITADIQSIQNSDAKT